MKVIEKEEEKKIKIDKWTQSICPICQKLIPMHVYEENNVVYLEKTCSEHGKFEDIYWGDAELYKYWQKWDQAKYMGTGIQNPRTDTINGCPFDCGICPMHRSHTVLSIIDVTNRCNMACPVCFAYAGAIGYVYEPNYEQIVEMLKNLRSTKPWAPNAIQFSGGEPTLRNDLPKIIKEAKRLGFTHVEVNSNGIRLAEDIEYFKSIREAGMSTLYLQFDGLNPEIYKKLRGRTDLIPIKQKVIENARKIGLDSIVLVVTLAKGVNDNELGNIINYAIQNKDVVRCVNIQPISFVGRATKEKIKEMRITTPDVLKLIEEQTNGAITRWDFRPVDWPVPISLAMEQVKNRLYPRFTMNPYCGAATFILVENGKIIPITRIVDVDNFAETFWQIYYTAIEGGKTKAKLQLLKLLPLVKEEHVRKLFKDVLTKGSYKALGSLIRNMIMIGCMHFMDYNNFDVARVQRCVIHYALPNGSIIPFCTLNSLHRSRIEKEYSMTIDEWYKLHPNAKINDYV
jgi:uncharacterized radical SAM superfamily Fe-S cluster-containing enzyme